MREPIQNYFQVGTVQWMSYPGTDALKTLQKIAQDPFFDAIELTHFIDAGQRAQAKRTLEQSYLAVSYGAQPIQLSKGYNPNALEEEKRQQAERALLEAAEEAAYLGAEAMAFMAGPWEKAHREQGYRQLVKTAVSLCRYLEPMGMRLELEVFDYDLEKCSLIGPADYAEQFASELCAQCGNFGLLLDLSHFPTTYETSEIVLSRLAPYATHFHVGNAVVQKGLPAYGDQHPRLGFPGGANGMRELIEFLQILKRENLANQTNKAVLSFEIKPYLDEDPDLVLAGAKRYLQQAWAAVQDENPRRR